ncbi:MAG TPA: mannose-1-phosphate guanylyltransferase/mannose-6-phosphate isomerase [Azospira sp.]|nr:mannose-1-phosphate guanylyltransferase/mannose-6-phosphate isomerase [Azospira sp.]
MNIHPVILCGGSGTRLWPLSREIEPKQFLPLLRGRSPFQETLQRLQAIPGIQPPLIVTNQEHLPTVMEQSDALGLAPPGLLIEPMGRGTAPAVAVAAAHLLRQDPDARLLVLPADHDIPDQKAFCHAIVRGKDALERHWLVLFGLTASRPETGFGYIRRGAPVPGNEGCFEVLSFVEKPEMEVAQSLIASGQHYWNSGIFLFRAAKFLAEFARLEPELADICARTAASLAMDANQLHIDGKTFAPCRTASIDHAVIEKTSAAAMVTADFAWSDLGSWQALWEVAEKNEAGNVSHGDVHLNSVSNCYVHSSRRMVVGIGLQDLVIIETADALLVAARDQSQKVKEVVEQLKAQSRDECHAPRRVHRPWGHYEDVDSGERFRVKRITVNPGAKLSLQLHHHRAEHWVVVKGTARVTRGNEVLLLCENQSTYIPIGISHRLENPGKIPLEVIETQSGAYLKEDDIVRLQDAYHRV